MLIYTLLGATTTNHVIDAYLAQISPDVLDKTDNLPRRRHEITMTVIQLLGFSDMFDTRLIFKKEIDSGINYIWKHEMLNDMKHIACLFELHRRAHKETNTDTSMKSRLGLINSMLERSCLALKRCQMTVNNLPVVYFQLEHINDIKHIIKHKIAKKHEMGIDFSSYHAFYNLSQET